MESERRVARFAGSRSLLAAGLVATALAATACPPPLTTPSPVATSANPQYVRETGSGEFLVPIERRPPDIPSDAVHIVDISYVPSGWNMGGEADMTLDLYVPTSSPSLKGSRPVMVWFHGFGKAEALEEIAPAITELLFRGFIVASVEFTDDPAVQGLLPETPIAQAKAAVRFVKALEKLSPIYDASRVFVAGRSLGGLLASRVGLSGVGNPPLSEDVPYDSKPAGVVLFQPAVNLQAMADWVNGRYCDIRIEASIIRLLAVALMGCQLAGERIFTSLPSCSDPGYIAKALDLSASTYAADGKGEVGFYTITGSADLITQSVPQGRDFSAQLSRRGGSGPVIWGDVVGGEHGMNTVDLLANQFVDTSKPASVNMARLLSFLGCATAGGTGVVAC